MKRQTSLVLASSLVYISTEIKAELGQTRNRYLIIFNVIVESHAKSSVFFSHQKARVQARVLKC